MKYIDKEEKEIIKSYELDKWISTDENLKETILNAAKNQKNELTVINKRRT